MLNAKVKKYRLTGFTPLLGSQPCSEEIRTQFIASKAPVPENTGDECVQDLDEKGLTVFFTDPDHDDVLCLMDYQIRGFLKGAGRAIAKQLGVAALASKIDQLVFIDQRRIPILRDGNPVYDTDQQKERPLRAQTALGPRVTLAASEQILDPWQIEFSVTILENSGTKQSKPITFELIEDILDYGYLQGLGQWRTGGYGRFRWEALTEEEEA